MTGREIVRKAIEFQTPPRLPFFQHEAGFAPDDVCDCWEMDRQKNGWFFDPAPGAVTADDWGCRWAHTDRENMGQVVHHPLEDWAQLAGFRPPDPRDPFYFERISPILDGANGRYVIVTCHFNLMERLHMLHGFDRTLQDFYYEPQKIERLLDMILEFKIEQLAELARRFGDRVDGIFLTDDWGSQQNTLVGPQIFRQFFLERYRSLGRAVHGHGWHFFLHSCGRVNDFVPFFIEAGVDVLNMQQPRLYGLEEFGRRYAGKVAFLTTTDIQRTLPAGDAERVREEARRLVQTWSTPKGGLIVYNYGLASAIGVTPGMTEIMFRAFVELMNYWNG